MPGHGLGTRSQTESECSKQKLKLELLRGSKPKLESLPFSVVVHEHLVRAGCMFFGTTTRRTLTRLHRPQLGTHDVKMPPPPPKMGVVDIARITKAWPPRFDFGEDGRPSHDFSYFSIPFLPWVFHRRLFKVLRKKNEIHCIVESVFFLFKTLFEKIIDFC